MGMDVCVKSGKREEVPLEVSLLVVLYKNLKNVFMNYEDSKTALQLQMPSRIGHVNSGYFLSYSRA